MRPYLLSLVLLLAATATVPLVSAICIDKSESKSEAHGAAATAGGSFNEYGLPKKVVEKPKEANPYEEATSAKESSAPKKVKKEKSDDLDVSAAYLKKEKKEKSGDSDKKEKKKFVDFHVSASPKKEKKEKSDDSDESSSSKKKEEKSDGSDEYDVSPKKEKKEKKSHDSDEEDAAAKKEKKKKSTEADASAYFKKEKKAEKAKKKGKSNDSSENEEKSDEDAAPVDVSATGEYVPPNEAKAEEDTTPADVSAVPNELSPAAKSYADEFASQKTQADASQQQPMGGAPDELPPAAKQSSAAASTSTSQQPMGGAPDELPPSAAKQSSGGDPYAGGMPSEPKKKKPKLSMESFGGMIKRHVVSPVVKRVCANTQYPEDCESSIAGLPGGGESRPAADPVAVLRLAMEAVREKAIEAMNAATDRMNAAGTEATVKEALGDCTSLYSDIRSNLEVVDEALKRGDLATARTNLDSVETDVTTCDDGFAERGTPSVMTDHDQELQKLASDLIAIGANSIHHA